MHHLAESALLRLPQIIGQREVTAEEAARNEREGNNKPKRPRPRIDPLLPVCKSQWWAGVHWGKYPKPIKNGRATLWRARDIRDLLERLGKEGAL